MIDKFILPQLALPLTNIAMATALHHIMYPRFTEIIQDFICFIVSLIFTTINLCIYRKFAYFHGVSTSYKSVLEIVYSY